MQNILTLNRTSISERIAQNVDQGITSNITNIKIRRNLVPLYNELANYEICYLNQFHADLEGFNIKSTSRHPPSTIYPLTPLYFNVSADNSPI